MGTWTRSGKHTPSLAGARAEWTLAGLAPWNASGFRGRQRWDWCEAGAVVTPRLSGQFVRLCSGIICTECRVGTSAVPGHVSTCLGLLALPWCGRRDMLFCNAGTECGAPLEKENYSSEAVRVLLLFCIV